MERNDNLGNLGDVTGAGQGGTTGGVGGTAGGTGGYGAGSGFGGGTSDVGGGSGFGATAGGIGNAGNAGNTGGTAGTGGFGGPAGGAEGGGAAGMGERARNLAGNAQEKLSDVGSTVRERAGNVKNTLADALEAGAERLRNRGGAQQLAGTTGYGEASMATDGGTNRAAQLGDRVAGGLQTSADWLREADIDNLRQGVERQVRENPGRTLLIAVGLGYLLGKAFRR